VKRRPLYVVADRIGMPPVHLPELRDERRIVRG
jgi:hypothetical protein